MVKSHTRRKSRQLYVEGGGDQNPSLATECRKAFSKLFDRAGIESKPRVVVCGSRTNAYDQFCRALVENQAECWLLVDAEETVSAGHAMDPWAHVKSRDEDGWARPRDASDEQLHFMNVVMESWLLCDQAALKKVFGPKLDVSKLPPESADLEAKDKFSVYQALSTATRSTPTGLYSKGSHSFKVLAEVSPDKLRNLAWAKRFLDELSREQT